ncbi:MAG: glutamate 5-kinase [Bacteroidetes bacterium]|nr:glutamate 5-kinase [Bacteroidota bacterium]MDF1864311.1 glutamate 5-kinase [Saprospiraceae bacterium]
MGRRVKQRILLKVGTSTLTRGTDSISRGKIEDIGRQIVKLQDQYEFILVSSGAIAVAKQFVNLEGNGQTINEKQALAAIGQPHLMRIIQESFRELRLLTAQCLLTYHDFDNPTSRDNITNTIEVLLKNGYIPVINENDTVATEEIQFGDNDKLAALASELLNVDLLVMATNTYGVYDADPSASNDFATIELLSDAESLIKDLRDTKSNQGSGGMKSKIQAAAIAQKAGIETWLVNGSEEDFLIKVMEREVLFTKVPSF